jgi:UDP-2,3-diacylglucosamine hydrolase
MQESSSKKIYFASDFHLGAPDFKSSLEREKLICKWMDEIKPSCTILFLVGDIFDFWFEYNQAIPKGFIRLQGKIAEFTDAGITVHLFTGNHDMWIFDYLPKELGLTLHREPCEFIFDSKRFLIGHGDGLGPGDFKYKFLKKIFSSTICQWLFGRLHPNLGIGLANYFSKSSRKSNGSSDEIFLGNEGEWLVQYCKEITKTKSYDYFVFGHRHLPLEIEIAPNSTYINLGDWIKYFTYGEFSDGKMKLKKL